MILGFAHITKNVPIELLMAVDIPSAREKWPLMVRQAEQHRLRFETNRHGVIEELVGYDTVMLDWPGRLGVKMGTPCISARDYAVELEFLREGLGFKVIGAAECGNALHYRLGLGSANPAWRIHIGIDVDRVSPIDPPLDIAGYAALAFYSSDVEADRDHLLKHGGRTPTEPFMVELDRKMKVIMLRSPEGTIIELIQVMP